MKPLLLVLGALGAGFVTITIGVIVVVAIGGPLRFSTASEAAAPRAIASEAAAPRPIATEWPLPTEPPEGGDAPIIGDTRVMGSMADKGVAQCLPDADDLNTMERALAAGETQRYKRSIASAIGLDKGTLVRIIERDKMNLRLRVLEGPYIDWACWVKGDVRGLFQ